MVLSTRFTSQLDTLVAATITTAMVLVSLISYSRSSSDSKRLRAKVTDFPNLSDTIYSIMCSFPKVSYYGEFQKMTLTIENLRQYGDC